MSALGDEAATVLGFVRVLSNQTEQRLVEVALRASEERLRALVSASSESLYSMSPDWSEMRQLTGGGFLADTDSANASWLEDYIPPDDQPQVVAAIEAVRRTKGVFELEHRVRRADGSIGWTLSRAVPLLDERGEVTEWFGTAGDVTARREAEEALRRLNETLEQRVEQRTSDLRQSQARASVYFNLSPEYLLLVRVGMDRTVRFEDINPSAEKVFGCRRSDVLGQKPDAVVPPPGAHDIERHALACSDTGMMQSYQAVRTYQEGQEVIIDARVALVERAGEDSLVLFSGRDVTEQSRIEAQLRQSQKMEAVGQLTGGLAHDFNNLLAGISGSLELLQIRVAQGRIGDLDRYITAAQGASRRAAALTHRLLAFTRRQTLDPRSVDLNRLVAGMEELVTRTVGPAVTVEVAGASGLWTALADPNQLENALLNLCINARDAMPDGGRITVEAANHTLDERTAHLRDLAPGQYVALCVSDTGTGMTPEVMRRAFEPFFTTKPIGMGTGLGLSMIYGFAQQSGGQVRIHSEVGRGTTVRLYLPRHRDDAVALEPSPKSGQAPRAETGQTVLVVDDEPTVRTLVAEVLEDLGYTAIEAADGPAGLRVLQSDVRTDLLVTDVGLPGGMNGRQLADAARVTRPGLKVLFITGYAENAVLSHGHLEPGMHVLTKPFAMEALANRVKELITTV